MGQPLSTLGGCVYTGGTSSEEWGFPAFPEAHWLLCTKRLPIGWCSLGQGYFLVLAPTRPPALGQLECQVELQVAPPIPREGGLGQASRPWTPIGLEGEAGCCGRCGASPAPPVPFPGSISPGA